ncbi:MAG: lytic transglycosylase domain-containing protein [Bdellovibrio sp.]|nr:MAG: lytic transglycosylase domain-containing protein [Bdellovibrio sp.]
MMVKNIILVVFSLLFLVHCGPAPFKIEGPAFTGATNKDGVPYIDLAGIPRREGQFEDSGVQFDLSKEDKALAQSISHIQLRLLDKSQKKVVYQNPAFVKITIKIDGKNWTFQGPLVSQKKQASFKKLKAGLYELNGLCDNSNCTSRVQIDLVKKDILGVAKAKAYIYGKSYWTKVSQKTNAVQLYNQVKYSWVTTWSVSYGPSFYSIQFFKEKGPSSSGNSNPSSQQAQTKPSDSLEPLPYVLEGQGIQTDNNDGIVEVVSSDHSTPSDRSSEAGQASGSCGDPRRAPKAAKLVGLNPEKGGQVFVLKDCDDKEVVLVVGGESQPESQSSSQTSTNSQSSTPVISAEVPGGREDFFRGANEDSWLKSLLTPKSRSLKMIQSFERNWILPQVQSMMKNRLSRGRETLERFLISSKPFVPHIEKIYQTYDVPSPLLYVFLLESSYFTGFQGGSPVYPIQSASSSSAVGPAQFIQATARQMGLRVRSSYDERRYFLTSACAAAKYYGKLYDNLQDHPDAGILSVLAYKVGPGAVEEVLQCRNYTSCVGGERWKESYVKTKAAPLYLAHKYHFSFREMMEYHMIPRILRANRRAGHEDSENYLLKFLAYYFIFGEYEKYGLHLDFNAVPKGLPSNFFPVEAPQDRRCSGLYPDRYSI